MNAPPFPINPEVGQWFGNWVWNGARWVASPTTGFRVITQTIAQSGPYMPSPGLVSCVVECFGAGGAGGGAVLDTGMVGIVAGAGGGSGGYSRKVLPAALVRGGVLVTVGTGGVYGQGTGQGGATSFGVLCVANGGWSGGTMNPSISAPEPGAPAAPGTGDVAMPGGGGMPGMWQIFTAATNMSAGCPLGGWIWGGGSTAMIGSSTTVDGPDGQDGTGAGGAGGCVNQNPGSIGAGGSGGSGLCIVTEFCWGDRDAPDIAWNPPTNVNLTVRQAPPGPWPPGPGWPPGWWPGGGWPPGWGPGPWPRGMLPQGQEFEAGAEPFSQDPQDPEDP